MQSMSTYGTPWQKICGICRSVVAWVEMWTGTSTLTRTSVWFTPQFYFGWQSTSILQPHYTYLIILDSLCLYSLLLTFLCDYITIPHQCSDISLPNLCSLRASWEQTTRPGSSEAKAGGWHVLERWRHWWRKGEHHLDCLRTQGDRNTHRSVLKKVVSNLILCIIA